MTDTPQSPEAVAFELYRLIAKNEHPTGKPIEADRAYILSTYAECLKATTGKYSPNSIASVGNAEPRIRKL